MALSSKPARLGWIGLILVLIAVARIASTYKEFTQTVDEPSHLASGMQLIQDRVYYMTAAHPPLARLTMSLGPYLAGLRLSGPGRGVGNEQGDEILNANGKYWRNLSLARLGTLPFFLLGCVVVWAWSCDLFGKTAALLALFFFTSLPTILAHSGIATNDMAAAATAALALYSLTLWVAKPSWRTAAGLGFSAGMAAATKFSALLFLPVCGITLLVLTLRRPGLGSQSLRRSAGHLLLAVGIAYFIIWASYLFTFAPLQSTRPHTAVDRLLRHDTLLHDAVCTALEIPLPAGKMAAGIAELAGHNKAGHVSFFLGEWRRHGWWYFFPVIFLLKTPIPFLLFYGLGGVFLIRIFLAKRDWQEIAPLLFAALILAASMTSSINVGVRHILAVYLLGSIVAGYCATKLWHAWRYRVIARLAVLAGCFSMAASSALAHPDYLAYFNWFASDHPERIAVDSDLDWGQDLARLSTWLQKRGVQELAISYFGTADLTRAGLPPYHELEPYRKVSGWIAISARNRAIPTPFLAQPQTEGQSTFYSVPGNFISVRSGLGPFSWLLEYPPAARIGRSIFVYHIPASLAGDPYPH